MHFVLCHIFPLLQLLKYFKHLNKVWSDKEKENNLKCFFSGSLKTRSAFVQQDRNNQHSSYQQNVSTDTIDKNWLLGCQGFR